MFPRLLPASTRSLLHLTPTSAALIRTAPLLPSLTRLSSTYPPPSPPYIPPKALFRALLRGPSHHTSWPASSPPPPPPTISKFRHPILYLKQTPARISHHYLNFLYYYHTTPPRETYFMLFIYLHCALSLLAILLFHNRWTTLIRTGLPANTAAEARLLTSMLDWWDQRQKDKKAEKRLKRMGMWEEEEWGLGGGESGTLLGWEPWWSRERLLGGALENEVVKERRRQERAKRKEIMEWEEKRQERERAEVARRVEERQRMKRELEAAEKAARGE